jgi:hypothetical protein
MSIAAYEDGFDTCAATGKRIYISASKAHVYARRIQVKNKRNGTVMPSTRSAASTATTGT